MSTQSIIRTFFVLYWLTLPISVMSATRTTDPGETLYDQHRWSVMYYYGIAAKDPLTRILRGTFHRWPEHLHSVELAYTLNEENSLRAFFHPIVDVVQVAGNVSLRIGSNQALIKEFEPYLIFRWSQFPWNQYINTSFAIGEGISYASSIPALEKRDHDDAKRLLNYLMLETTFALPLHPEWQTVIRIHHRSGAYGLYHAGNTGSNELGLGIRYLFN